MENKKKKGFTLVELLVVIIIVGLIASAAVPMVIKYLRKSEDAYYNSLEKNILTAANEYYSDNRSELPPVKYNGKPGENILFLSDLAGSNYLISEVVDSNGNKCYYNSSYVYVKNDRGVMEKNCLFVLW